MRGLQDLNVLQANAWVYWQAIEDAEIGNFWGLIQVGAMRDPWVAPGWHAAHTPQSCLPSYVCGRHLACTVAWRHHMCGFERLGRFLSKLMHGDKWLEIRRTASHVQVGRLLVHRQQPNDCAL